MTRSARVAPGGMLFHVLNRGVGRMQIFRAEKDYEAFQGVVEQTLRVAPIRICAYCWMPNHWHFVLARTRRRPFPLHAADGEHAHATVAAGKASRGYGHLHQGRFKSDPIEGDEHFYAVVRYVERNALRAGLAQRAEDSRLRMYERGFGELLRPMGGETWADRPRASR